MLKSIIIPLLCLFIQLFAGSCKKNSATSGTTDPNGNWLVTIPQNVHCFAPGTSKVITVSGGQFSSTIVSFTRNGCTESLSIQGTLTMGNINFVLSGNETMSGSCCNGVNGFFSYIDPTKTPINVTVSSNWGPLTFEKQ